MKIRDIHKVVVMGAGSVGKTSIVMQFMEGYFVSQYKPTVEDYYRHTIQLTDGVFQTVEILDTAGTHYFPAMRELNIRSGRGFVLVFSVDSMSSFLETIQLYEQIVKIKETSQVPIVLVGNKSDLKSQRQVPLEVILTRKQLEMNNCPYIETSAKFNCNVGQLFLQLLQLAKQQQMIQPTTNRKGKLLLMRRLSSSFGSLPNISLLRRRSAQQNEPKTNTTGSTVAPKPAPNARRLLELQLRGLSVHNNGSNSGINNNGCDSPSSLNSGCSIGTVSSGSSGSVCSSSSSVNSNGSVGGSVSSGFASSQVSSASASPVVTARKPHHRLQAVRACSDASEPRRNSKIGSPVLGRRLLQHLVRPQLSLDENRLGFGKSSRSSKCSLDSGSSTNSSGSSASLLDVDDQRCSIM